MPKRPFPAISKYSARISRIYGTVEQLVLSAPHHKSLAECDSTLSDIESRIGSSYPDFEKIDLTQSSVAALFAKEKALLSIALLENAGITLPFSFSFAVTRGDKLIAAYCDIGYSRYKNFNLILIYYTDNPISKVEDTGDDADF